jgi:hypothetical protein
LVARFVRDEEAVGSNPATPTHESPLQRLKKYILAVRRSDCQAPSPLLGRDLAARPLS